MSLQGHDQVFYWVNIEVNISEIAPYTIHLLYSSHFTQMNKDSLLPGEFIVSYCHGANWLFFLQSTPNGIYHTLHVTVNAKATPNLVIIVITVTKDFSGKKVSCL